MVELLQFRIDRLDVEQPCLLSEAGLQRHVVFICSPNSRECEAVLALHCTTTKSHGSVRSSLTVTVTPGSAARNCSAAVSSQSHSLAQCDTSRAPGRPQLWRSRETPRRDGDAGPR